MKKQFTKYALMAFLGLAGIIACSDDDSVNNVNEDKSILHIDKQSLSFDETIENTTKELTFVVTNKGNAVLKIISANLIGTNKTEFTTTTVAKEIQTGKSETFKVTFKPTSTGDKTASLQLKTNDGDKNIVLTGKSIKTPIPIININKESLDFGEVKSKYTKELTFVVTNKGNAVLKIISADIVGTHKWDFSTTVTAKEIQAGESETFKVTFKPRVSGDKTARLELKTNSENKNISLKGKALRNLDMLPG